MKIIPFTETRVRLSQILNELQETGEPVCITRFGRAIAVLLNYEQHNMLIEQLTDLKNAFALHQGQNGNGL